jgi:hypothetical protein
MQSLPIIAVMKRISMCISFAPMGPEESQRIDEKPPTANDTDGLLKA